MQAKCLLAGQKPGMAYNKTHTWLSNQNFDRYFCIISLNTMETWKLSWLHWQHKLIPSPLFLRSFCSGFVSCSQVPCGQNTIQFYAKMLQTTLLLMPSIKAGLLLFTLFLSLDKKWCRCKGKNSENHQYNVRSRLYSFIFEINTISVFPYSGKYIERSDDSQLI